METLRHELQVALRTLARSPGTTAIVALILALGIGANAAMFSVVNGVLLRPLDFVDADRLVMIWENDRLRGTTREGVSAPDFFDWQEQSTVFARMAAYSQESPTLTATGAEPVKLSTASVTHELLSVLGVVPPVGRGIDAEDDLPGSEPVAILGHGLWQRRFGSWAPLRGAAGDDGVVGGTIELDGVEHTVIGIMPPGFAFPSPDVELWRALRVGATTSSRGRHSLSVVARLADGASREQADVEVATIMRRLEEAYPDDNAGRGAWVQPLLDAYVGDVRPALVALWGAVGLVLLIVCANVANLLLARAAARRREVAIRQALGAGRPQMIRQFLLEGLLLAMLGGFAGVGLAKVGVAGLLALAGDTLPRAESIGLDARVLAFTALVALVSGVLFSLVPARYAWKTDLRSSLSEGGRGGLGRHRVRQLLVVSELALAVLLTSGAGLLIRSYQQLQQVDPGFTTAGRLTFDVVLPASRYPQTFGNWPAWTEVVRFQDELAERLRRLPGVEAVAMAQNHPMNAGWTTRYAVDGRPPVDPGERDEARLRAVSPGYFETAGIRLVKGRLLTERDRAGAPDVMILNEAFVRKVFPDENPIGQRVSFFSKSCEVVGVVADVKFTGLARPAAIAMYPPLQQAPFPGFSVILDTSSEVAALAPLIRGEIRGLDPDLPLGSVSSLDEIVGLSVAQPRLNMLLLAGFALMALALAAIGVYGVISQGVAERTREIGLRRSLGARHRDILRLVFSRGLSLALAGTALGLTGAVALTRFLESLLFGVGATDLATFATVAAVLLVVALAACYLPARRAVRVDPMVALRYE